jgi:hypothetical protein
MNARYVFELSGRFWMLNAALLKLAAIKLHQKAISDNVSSFGQLSQLGY